jgi:hypothetical protein
MASIFKRGGKKNRNGYYYVQWYDANGMRRTRCAKTNDRDAAQQFANQLEAKAMMRREGIIDSTAERLSIERRRPIEDALRTSKPKCWRRRERRSMWRIPFDSSAKPFPSRSGK